MTPNRILTVVFALFSFWASALQAASEGTPIKLSKSERNRLEALGCLSQGVTAERISAYKFEASKGVNSRPDLPARTSAYVECKAHGQVYNKPLRYVDDCDKIDGEWDCSPPQLEIPVTINGRDVKMRPWGLTPEKAHDLLKHLGTMQMFQGESIDKAIGNSCDVSKTKDPEEIEFSCEAAMALSFRCPLAEQTGCPRLLYLTFDKPAYLRRRQL
jgi:hypothetical protein